MKSYKNKNYEQALIETILKFDELLKNEKINEFLKHYSKRRALNGKCNFSIDMMSKKNLMENKENDINNNNYRKNHNYEKEKSENNEKEFANFDGEFHKICEKIKDENELFPVALDDKMKMKIIESDFDGILGYFNNNLNENDITKTEIKIPKRLSFDKNYFESKNLNKFIFIKFFKHFY